MDLKFCNKHFPLHNRLCKKTISKDCYTIKQTIIIKKIFQIWISVYGLPQEFLCDNGGKFVDDSFINIHKARNINCRLTGAESRWSNGPVERHILENMLEETTYWKKQQITSKLLQHGH